ncbi:hypothetical protein DEO72_LG5g937 [Vigna unguiculata]|uniref:Uncharacterized protein n=1 Tax=Vigna unguiculata TaxID=3917 RepID=A0A4D6LWY4_VIGUN|nr:hypothetical protein DEO72_LG5g937 [Vigna unguiculata]
MFDGVLVLIFQLPSSIKGKPFHLRSLRDSSLNTIHEPFRCVSPVLSENQSVERRLGELFRRYRDGGASSSGIQSHSCLDRVEISVLPLLSAVISSIFLFDSVLCWLD